MTKDELLKEFKDQVDEWIDENCEMEASTADAQVYLKNDIVDWLSEKYDFILSQYKQQLVEQIRERCKQTARFDEQDAIDIINGGGVWIN